MIPDTAAPTHPRVKFSRLHGGSCWVGASWVYRPSFRQRLTHIYLGRWFVTIRTRGQR